MRVPEAELDALDEGAPVCMEVRPQTFGHQMCWRIDGHDGAHKSQDAGVWGGMGADHE